MKKKILIIDDDMYLLNSIASYLRSEDFQVDIAKNGYSGLQKISSYQPNLIITDIMMPHLDGYDLIKKIRTNKTLHKIPIILLTAKGMTNDRILGYNLGCNAYLTKPFYPQELIAIIKNIFNSIELSNKYINNKSFKELNTNSINDLILNKLTNRECKILSLVAKGYMNKEIANEMKLSLRNVEKYVSRLLQKTGTRNRTELAKLALLTYFNIHKGE
uniref:Probable transcriptional regulator ycf27 n=2 Tax=Gracilariopsis TaxID=2781 RepID=A0A1C9CF53_9FLOR|nr:TctD-like protein [Gracilariopsis lemaneiformis]YP_009294753.1 hypothetical protein Gch_154 [Gracilariopsis chorda]AJO68394.1 tctD transcriptional regulator [Gracilariopsis lemaneiformis]AML79931.1 TctD-like protein [Gracilariopsis lemaneiformis]AOM67013.1 hypothetical protein Gch_154 [Gracilariopsis chorda]UAD88929.1 hypothetical protein [Gracilariopsis chorda]